MIFYLLSKEDKINFNIPKCGIELALGTSELTESEAFTTSGIGFVEGETRGCIWRDAIEGGKEMHEDRVADAAAADEARSCSLRCFDSMWRHFIRLFWNQTFT